MSSASGGNCRRIFRPRARRTTALSSFNALGVFTRIHHVLHAEVRVVKRTYGWLGRGPRMVKDYENLTRSHIGFILRR